MEVMLRRLSLRSTSKALPASRLIIQSRPCSPAKATKGFRTCSTNSSTISQTSRRSFQPLLRRTRPQQRFYSNSQSSKPPHYDPTPNLNSPPASLSLSQRLRKLSREYGWSAFGVYLLLSALDFPFCFAAVRLLGVDRIGHAEKVIVEWIGGVVPDAVKMTYLDVKEWVKQIFQVPVKVKDDEAQGVGNREAYGVVVAEDGVGDAVGEYDHGVAEAERLNRSEHASIWTQLVLAYAIHKSFIFIRIPLTVAVTPKVVKVLRGWGWNIGKRKLKAS